MGLDVNGVKKAIIRAKKKAADAAGAADPSENVDKGLAAAAEEKGGATAAAETAKNAEGSAAASAEEAKEAAEAKAAKAKKAAEAAEAAANADAEDAAKAAAAAAAQRRAEEEKKRATKAEKAAAKQAAAAAEADPSQAAPAAKRAKAHSDESGAAGGAAAALHAASRQRQLEMRQMQEEAVAQAADNAASERSLGEAQGSRHLLNAKAKAASVAHAIRNVDVSKDEASPAAKIRRLSAVAATAVGAVGRTVVAANPSDALKTQRLLQSRGPSASQAEVEPIAVVSSWKAGGNTYSVTSHDIAGTPGVFCCAHATRLFQETMAGNASLPSHSCALPPQLFYFPFRLSARGRGAACPRGGGPEDVHWVCAPRASRLARLEARG